MEAPSLPKNTPKLGYDVLDSFRQTLRDCCGAERRGPGPLHGLTHDFVFPRHSTINAKFKCNGWLVSVSGVNLNGSPGVAHKEYEQHDPMLYASARTICSFREVGISALFLRRTNPRGRLGVPLTHLHP